MNEVNFGPVVCPTGQEVGAGSPVYEECWADSAVDLTHLLHTGQAAEGWSFGGVGSAFMGYGSFVGEVIGMTTATVVDALKDSFLNDNHPWKQKKYQCALNELLCAFQARSGVAPADLIQQIESHAVLQASALKDALLVVLRAMARQSENYRACYYDLLLKLRQALEGSAFQRAVTAAVKGERLDEAARLLLQLCEARYGDVHLYSFCECLVDGVIAAGLQEAAVCQKLQQSDFEAIDRACFSSMGAMRLAVKKGCMLGWLNVGFDPAMQQNVPFVLMDIPMASFDQRMRNVRFLRMGSPTIEGYVAAAQVNLEFRYFIQALALEGKRHLYVSLQSDFSYGVGSESGRNRAIKILQEDFANFYVVVLDQDSDFYKQQGLFADLSGEAFLELFRLRLLGEECGYYFPPAWKSDEAFLECLDVTFEICSQIVLGVGDLSQPAARRNFIEIFYAFLLIFLTRYANVDFVNVTCKDAIDRAMKTLSLFLQIVIAVQGKADDVEYQKIHKVLTHAPAFMVKKQAMLDSRRLRLMEALDLLGKDSSRVILAGLADVLGLAGGGISIQRRGGQEFL